MINYKDEAPEEFKYDDQTVLLQLIEHIELKQEGSMSDYILDFCGKYNYHIEDVADLVKNNSTIKALLKQDCIFRGILTTKTPKVQIEEW